MTPESICVVYACLVCLYRCHICRWLGYAYVRPMQMSGICICHTYARFSLLLRRSEKRWFRIFLTRHGAQRRRNTTCATPSAAISSICCVYPLPLDRPLSTGKGRCGYFVCMVHFRKVSNREKIGSRRIGDPVI